ncbi:hypothetical protein LOD99_8797 [Oopsacas minuta]|uniref:Uncharacterized protein n=1 Tax=Oopsacas minuta TaxID=111878 RepID=A0AAV7JGI1_9METZ|nr:hypothetical protein LOD99_8797 [Oopsacas minuta]
MDFDGGIISTNEPIQSPRDNFDITKYIPILDHLVFALDQSIYAFQILNERFDVWLKIGSDDNSAEEVSEATQKLVSVYSQNLEPSLGDELVQLSEFVSLCQDEKAQDESH